MQSSSLTTCIFIKDRTANYAHVDKQGMTNLQNNSFTLFSSRSWGGASRLLSLQLLVRNELFVLGKGLEAPSTRRCASWPWSMLSLASLMAQLAPAFHLQEYCTVYWQITHFLGDPFFHMSTPGPGALAVEDDDDFLPFPPCPHRQGAGLGFSTQTQEWSSTS